MKGHAVALWAGLTALFVNLAAIKVVEAVGNDNPVKIIGVVVTSFIIGASVYCKQRLDDAKQSEAEKADQ